MCALTTVVPVTAELRVIVQLPVPPAVVHGFGEVKAPGPLSIVKLICVPSGAFTKPPVPVFTLTCAVNVCAWPTAVRRVRRRDLDVRVDVRLDRVARVEAGAVGLRP